MQSHLNTGRDKPGITGSPNVYTIQQVTATDPAPTILIHLSSDNGSHHMQVLPDSGVDVSAAGQQLLQHLNEHVNNLLPSEITPWAANGSKMYALGKLMVTLSLKGKQHTEEMHIYPDVPGTIISWKAARALGILPEHYPNPVSLTTTNHTMDPNIRANTSISMTSCHHKITQAFPTVFDGQIRKMEGEKFHIYLKPEARPFRISTP